jgi:hypothetical protein
MTPLLFKNLQTHSFLFKLTNKYHHQYNLPKLLFKFIYLLSFLINPFLIGY